MQQKEKYQKSQIERLNRQVSDVRQENTALRDEIAHYDQQLREAREQQYSNQKLSNIQDNLLSKQRNTVQYSGIGTGVMNKIQESKTTTIRPGSSQHKEESRSPIQEKKQE